MDLSLGLFQIPAWQTAWQAAYGSSGEVSNLADGFIPRYKGCIRYASYTPSHAQLRHGDRSFCSPEYKPFHHNLAGASW